VNERSEPHKSGQRAGQVEANIELKPTQKLSEPRMAINTAFNSFFLDFLVTVIFSLHY
jgi:hypothetical protein